MKKYIIVGGDGKEYGPVSIQEVKEWVSSGRANGDTRIKEEGAEEWSRLRDMEFFGVAAKPAGPPTTPSQTSTPSVHNPQVTPPPTAGQLIGELQVLISLKCHCLQVQYPDREQVYNNLAIPEET